jgi:dethiobiotin synthetase
MLKEWFITGTDTGVGKTRVTLALMQYYQQQGWRVVGMKPIATGCESTPAGLRNADAQQILQLSSLPIQYAQVNPYSFLPPIAPHLAAAQAHRVIEIEKIVRAYYQLSRLADIVLVEGIGGWRVPLNAQHTLKDMVLSLNLPVILVVGLRLGCINHALLTAETIVNDGCQLHGWIANHLTAEGNWQEVINSLEQRLSAPLLSVLPFSATDDGIPQIQMPPFLF